MYYSYYYCDFHFIQCYDTVLDVCNIAVMMVGDCYLVYRGSLRSSEKGMHRILVVQIKRFRPGRTGKRTGKGSSSLLTTTKSGNHTKLRSIHHRVLLRIIGTQRKRLDHRMASYNRALGITRCESIETTLRTRRTSPQCRPVNEGHTQRSESVVQWFGRQLFNKR